MVSFPFPFSFPSSLVVELFPVPRSLPPVKVQITKRTDGGSVLKCIRSDGTETWQKNHGPTAAFFPLHDLTHYAVETELGISDAFFGLVAQGWSIEETGQRGVAARLPGDALFVENIVGTLDAERASSARWTAEEFNENIARHAAKGDRPVPRALTDAELARIRKRRAELFTLWRELPAGETLVLTFAAAATPKLTSP